MYDVEKLDQVHKLTIHPEYFNSFTKSYFAALTPGDVPEYQDFILRDRIAPLLTIISVLDLQKQDSARYRFCGSMIVEKTGTDLTGLDLLDLVPPEGRDGLYADMRAMIHHPCGNFSQHIDLFSSGKGLKSDSLALPLKSRRDSQADLLITLHASEWTILSENHKRASPGKEDVQIGIDWVQSIFVDIGNGTPGPTNFQRSQSGVKP